MRAMRRLTAGLCCAAALAVSAPGASAHPDVLNIVSWGGVYTASQMRAYVNPFRETTNKPIQVDRYSGGLEEVEAQVTAMNVKWDVIDLGLANAVRGCREGLFERFDHATLPPAPDGTPPADDFLEGMLPECAVGQNVFSNVIAYDTRQFTNVAPPQTAEDFFNVRKYRGHRGMRANPRGNLELALLADGVPPAEVYDVLSTEEGLERAFDRLRDIAPVIVWWEGAERPQQLLDKQNVAMTTAFNGRMQRAIDNRGKPFEIIWDGQTYDYELWAVVKGSPHKEAAMEFIRFASQPLRQAAQANFVYYGPARKSAMAMVDGTVRPKLPTAEENLQNALRIDFEWWAKRQKELDRRFEAFIESAKAQAGTELFGIGTAR